MTSVCLATTTSGSPSTNPGRRRGGVGRLRHPHVARDCKRFHRAIRPPPPIRHVSFLRRESWSLLAVTAPMVGPASASGVCLARVAASFATPCSVLRQLNRPDGARRSSPNTVAHHSVIVLCPTASASSSEVNGPCSTTTAGSSRSIPAGWPPVVGPVAMRVCC